MKALRVVFAILGWTLVVAVALTVSLYYHLSLPLTRRVAADTVNEFVTSEMAGELSIGRVDVLTPDEIVTRHISLYAPDGTRVIIADRVVLTPDIDAALNGKLRFSSARLTTATVRLETGASGLPTLIEAFQPADPTPGTGEPLHAIVDGMQIEDVNAYGEVLGLRGLVVQNVSATGRLEAQGDVEITVTSARGEVIEPFPWVGRVEGMTASIYTDPMIGLDLTAYGTVEREDGVNDTISATVVYRIPEGGAPTDPQELDIRVSGQPAHGRLLSELGYSWGELFTGELNGDFRLSGPPEDLELAFDADTEGGPLSLRGSITADQQVLIEGTTEGMTLADLVVGAPPLEIAGEGRIVVDTSDPDAPPSVRLELEPFVFDRYAVPALAFEGTIHDDHVVIDRVDAPYAGGEVSGSGLVGFDGRIDLRVRGRIPQIAADPNIRRHMPDARGSASADLHLVQGGLMDNTFGLSGTITFRNFVYGPLTARRLRLRGRVGGSPDRPTVRLNIDGDAVAVAEYPLGTADLRVTGGPRSYQAGGSFETDDERRVEFTSTIDARGNDFVLNAPTVEYAVGDLVWRGSATDVLFVPDRSVSARRILLASGSQRLEAWGEYQFRGDDDIEMLLQDFDLAGLRALFRDDAPEVSGHADAHVKLTGDVSNPVLVVQGALRDGSALGLDGIDAFYAVAYEEGALSADGSIDLRERGSLSLVASGLLDSSIADPFEALEGGTYEATLDVSELDLEVARILLGAEEIPELDGHVTGTVSGSGPVFAPSFEGTLAVPELQAQGWPQLGLTTEFSYDSGVLSGRATTHDEEGAELAEAEGSLVIDVVNLVYNPREAIASLESLPWRVSLRMPTRLVGELPAPILDTIPQQLHPVRLSLSGTLAGGGLPTRADVYIDATWEGESEELGLCERSGVPRLSAFAHLEDGTTTVRGHGFLGPEHVVEIEATTQTPLSEWIAGAALPDRPPPTTVLGWFPRRPTQNEEIASGTVSLSRFFGVCDHATGPMSGAFALRELFSDTPSGFVAVASDAMRVLQSPAVSVSSRVDFDSEAAELVAELAIRQDQVGFIDGTIPLDWDELGLVPTLGDEPMRLSGDFTATPIGPLVSWLPQVSEVAGFLTGNIEMEGTVLDVQTRGHLELTEGYLELVGLGQHLTDVSGSIDLHDRGARLSRFTASDGDGSVEFQGDVELEGFVPRFASLDLQSYQFPVRREGTILATLTGEAGINARFGVDDATMTVAVRTLNVRLPEDDSRSVQALEAHSDIVLLGTEEEEPTDDELYPITLRIDARNPFWVRRNDFATQVAASLDVVYRDPNLLVGGSVSLQRGFFEVVGKRFDLERGTMNFDGGLEIDPVVNVVASHQLRGPGGTVVTVTATGRLSELDIDFASNHADCDTRGEIISMLVSGRCAALVTDAAGASARVDAGYADFLAGVLAGVLTLTARNELGDVLPVIVIESGDEAFRSARIRAGFQADSILPDAIREVIRGAYLEGVLTTSGEEGQAVLPGVLIELQFPYDIVTTGTFESADSWSFDVTWEP